MNRIYHYDGGNYYHNTQEYEMLIYDFVNKNKQKEKDEISSRQGR